MSPAKASTERAVQESANRASTIRLLRIAMVAALVVPAMLFAVWSWISYRDTQSLADERIERSLEVVEEQALKVLESVNLAFVAVDDLLDQRSETEIRQYEPELQNHLKVIAAALPEVQSIAVFDAIGRPEVTTEVFPAPASRSAAQDRFFRVLQEGFSGTTYIGRLQNTQLGGRAYWPLSRARYVRGMFEGVIEISVLPSDLAAFTHAL